MVLAAKCCCRSATVNAAQWQSSIQAFTLAWLLLFGQLRITVEQCRLSRQPLFVVEGGIVGHNSCCC